MALYLELLLPEEWFPRVSATCILQAIWQLCLVNSCALLEFTQYLGIQY